LEATVKRMMLVSELVDLIDYSIHYSIIFRDIFFKLTFTFVNILFNLSTKLIGLLEKTEYFIESILCSIKNISKPCSNIFTSSYDRLTNLFLLILHYFNFVFIFKFLSFSILSLTSAYIIVKYKKKIIDLFKTKPKIAVVPSEIITSETTLEKRIEKFESERLKYICCICDEHFRTILFMPCKHLCMCQVCFNIGYTTTASLSANSEMSLFSNSSADLILKNNKCPICRSYINEAISIYN
jgi:hypothetical protein